MKPKFGIQNVWIIEQACSVKMAGYWRRFFACVFPVRDGVEVHELNTQKKEQGKYPPILTEQAWSIKDL